METIKTAASNQTMKTIFERRAVRKFLPDMPDSEAIESIIAAGRMAPSAMNTQPWRFYVLTHRDTINYLSAELEKITGRVMLKTILSHPLSALKALFHLPLGAISFSNEDHVFHGAPVVVFLSAPKSDEWRGLDIGMCAENMMLAAQSMGISSCPVGLAKYLPEVPSFHKIEIPEEEEVLLAVVFGFAGESPKAHTRVTDNIRFVDRMEC